jgi:hypothetical protein
VWNTGTGLNKYNDTANIVIMVSSTKYFNVPIPLLKGVLTGEKEIGDFTQEVVRYSLYRHAKHLPYSDDPNAVEPNKISTQIKAAASFLNVNIGNIDRSISEGRDLFSQHGDKGTFCGINATILWDYNDNPKTERQIAQLCAFCATKSIIGKAAYKRTNKKLIVARMFGYSTFADFEKDAPALTARNISKEARTIREVAAERRRKYCDRYHIDKILTDLECDWGLKRYADHIRGMYISYESDLATLAQVCEDSKRSVKVDALKEAKRQAKLAAQSTTP